MNYNNSTTLASKTFANKIPTPNSKTNQNKILPILSSQKVNFDMQQQVQNLKNKYLQSMLNVFKDFQHTHNTQKLKAYLNKNRLQMLNLLDQLVKLKQQTQKQNQNFQSLQKKIQSKNNDIGQQTDFLIQNGSSRQKKVNFQAFNRSSQVSISQARKSQYLSQIGMNINQISEQSQKYQKQNQKIQGKLSTTPFYREWNLMCKQAEGSKNFNKRLLEQLQKKKTQLARISK